MRVYDFEYQLILSYNPCDIFKHFGVDELHGLSLKNAKHTITPMKMRILLDYVTLFQIKKDVYILKHEQNE
jgi:hypothetical protein